MSWGPGVSLQSDAIVAYRQANPTLTLKAIGSRYGVSRERVRQILKRAGAQTRALRTPLQPCPVCGESVGRTAKRFCSRACYSASIRIMLVCEECGAPFPRSAKLHAFRVQQGQRHIFCNNRCTGAWIGRTFGRAALATQVPKAG